VVHNRLDGPWDAFVLWVFFAALAGAAAAAAGLAGTLAWRLVARDRSRGREHDGDDWDLRAGELAWGLALFHLGFFVPFALYGRTYDEATFFGLGPPHTALGMALVLVAAAIPISAVVVAASIALARRIARGSRATLARRGRSVALASLTLHLGLALAFRAAPDGVTHDEGAYRPLRAPERASSRVVLVGLDGADWRLLRPMMERGELPTFARMVREGASGPLASIPGTNSAVLWSSLYTGKRPRQHGVLDFYRTRLPGMTGRGVFPVHRTFFIETADQLARVGLATHRVADRSFLRTRPLWEILDDLGASVGVVDAYHASVPARPLATSGGFFYSYALNALSERPGWTPDALDPGAAAVLFQPPESVRHYQPHAKLGDFHWQAATLLDAVAAEGQPDFLNLYTHEPDSSQHRTWRWLEPERFFGVDRAEASGRDRSVPDLYRAFDRFFETLLPRLAPGTTVLVVSDHGHSPTLVDRMDSQHRHGPPGIVLLWGADVGGGVELDRAHLYDVTPTLLHLLGLPVGADMAGRVLREALVPAVGDAPVRTLASYDAFAPADVEAGAAPDLSAEELERLRALGYL
jgi:hypothetical protein